MKLNKMYRLNILQGYAPKTSNNDEDVEDFYEDVETAMNKAYTLSMRLLWGTSVPKQEKLRGEHAIGHYGEGYRNSRGYMLLEFAERNQRRGRYTLFKKCKKRKWAWKISNGETK